MPEISIIVPIFNEEQCVEPLCSSLKNALTNLSHTWEIIMVDDGSSDNTWPLLKEQAGKMTGMHLIRLRRNFGQTAAMAAGIEHARGNIIITMDADLQNDPMDIPLLLEKIDQGFDVVSGWRKDRKDAFARRKLPSMIANRLISRMTGVDLHDFGCTLKAYRREIIRDVRLYGEMHRFIPALAKWVGGSVTEVAVNHHPRRLGSSKYGLSRTTRVILDLFTVTFLLRYSKSPIQMFGRIGLYLGSIGLMLLFGMVLANISANLFGTELAGTLLKRPFWVMTTFMLIFFGIHFITLGLLAEIQIRTYHESQNKPIYMIRETVDGGNFNTPISGS